MKNLGKKTIAGIALLVIGVSALIGLTNSKYINKVTGHGETEIAKWYFSVNDKTETMATIKLADTYNPKTLINGKIAPGTSGTFDIVIDATDAEVGIDYVVDFLNETNKPTNLKFTLGDKTFSNIEGYEQYFRGTIDADDNNKIRTLTVTWEWNYETGTTNSDKVDTNEGLSALDYTFDIQVTGTQVIPTKN